MLNNCFMQTPKKKKSIDGFYSRSQYDDGISSVLDSNGYDCLTQTNNEEVTFYNQIDKRIIVNNNVINLNVGGIKYTTTLTTLSNDKNSDLYKYAYYTLNDLEFPENENNFRGYFNFTDSNSGGVSNIFIDRDGKIFQFILNYLRDGDLICPDNDFIYQAILSDANFYKLSGLATLIKAKMNPNNEHKPVKVEPPKEVEVEMFSDQSQNTQLDCTDSIPLTQLTNGDFVISTQHSFFRIEENDDVEESIAFIQTTPVRLLGEEMFCTTEDF